MISKMFGAPLGGTNFAGQQGLESAALRLITPPKLVGGGGTYLPSIVIVALVEHGAPVGCCARAAAAVNRKIGAMRHSASKPGPLRAFSMFI
jgi:hypothetical protein